MRAAACVLGALLLAGCATVESGGAREATDADSRATVHTQLALGYLQRDQKKTALDELEQALDIAPENSQANYVMAMLQTQLDHPDRADYHYRRALDSNPQNSVAAHDYGIFLCKEGRVEEAMKYFNSALDNPLYDRKTLTNLRAGECLMNMRTDRRGAEPYLQAALEANPRLAPALYYMADIAYARERYLAARGYIERYFAVGPDTPATLLLAVKIESKLKARDVASEYAARLKRQFASSDEARQLKIYQ
ncbi:MAG TPA: type IV pilus biogenesis/stability protein PilW [Arenicellales bacterium]|nr:type IV pilus biogenesis/stability protein PilW [Arenicellales bacterium]